MIWADWSAFIGTEYEYCGHCPGAVSGTIDASDIQHIKLARYEAQVSEPFLDLISPVSSQAAELYEADVDGQQSYELTSLEDDAGHGFSSFEGDGSWWIALLQEGSLYWSPLYVATIGG